MGRKKVLSLVKSIRLLLVFLALTAAFIAVQPAAIQAAGSEPRYGGILKIGYQNQNLLSLGNPATMTGSQDGKQSEACLDTLFRYDENMNIVPRLGMSWEVAPDAKSITIALRKGVKFHDGSDFNAEVAKWNLENYKSSPKRELKVVESIDVIDDHTIRLNLSQYDSMLINALMSDPGRMISKKAYETHGKKWCEKHPVGTGPFQFVSWEKDVSIKFKKFDQYWDQGKPYLDGLELIFFAERTTSLMAFKSGELDILYATRLAKHVKQFEKEGKYQISRLPFGMQPFLAGDAIHPKSPFADIRVRRAMSYAIDNAAISKAVGHGYWVPLNQWAAPGTPAHNPEVRGYPYNPEMAKQLLAEAGYPNGFDTKLIHYRQESVVPAIQAYLAEVGIRAKLETMQRAQYHQVATGGGWENAICLVLTFAQPDILDSMKHIVSRGSIKFPSMMRPPGYEDLFIETLKATDTKTKNARAREMMKMGTDKYCMAHWLWVTSDIMVKQPYVRDDLIGEIPGWYISPNAWLSK